MKVIFRTIVAALAALCPALSLLVLNSASEYWSNYNKTPDLPTRPSFLTQLNYPLPCLTHPPDLTIHLTYPPIFLTHPTNLPTHQITSRNPQLTIHSTDSTNITILTNFHTFDQISQFRPNFTFWPHFIILTKLHNFNQISQSKHLNGHSGTIPYNCCWCR